MIICKFGGSSLSTSQNIINVIEIVLEKVENTQITCVLSAIDKTTDLLLNCSKNALIDTIYSDQCIDKLFKIHHNIVVELHDKNYLDFKGLSTIMIETKKICDSIKQSAGIISIFAFSNNILDTFGVTIYACAPCKNAVPH